MMKNLFSYFVKNSNCYTVNKTEVKIRDLFEINAGLYLKTHVSGNMYYLMARDYNEEFKIKSDIEPVIVEDDKTAKHILGKGDVLFASKGHNFFAAVYNEEVKPAVASSVFLVLRRKTNSIVPDYFAWYLNHPNIQKNLRSSSKGSTIPSISKKSLSEFAVPLPAIEIQEKIVEFENLRKKELTIRTELFRLKEELINNQLLNML